MNSTSKIIPERHIWHVAYVPNDLLIGAHGLLVGKDGYLYANNHSTSLFNLWPIPIDSWDYNKSFESELTAYTFWRIDTECCKNIWEIDPIMRGDEGIYTELPSKCFIRTSEPVSPECLLPFKFNNKPTSDLHLHQMDGVSSAFSLSNGLSLSIDQSLSNWMHSRNNFISK